MKLSILNPQPSTGIKVFACIALTVLFLLTAGASSRPSAADPVAGNGRLTNEISALEDRIETLERKLDHLERKLDGLDYSLSQYSSEIIDKIEDVEDAVKSLR
jgi:hypothetical protein